MQMPLEIAFHNVDASDWAKREIEARVEKLEGLYGRIIGARVRVDQRASPAGGSTPPVVRIEISLPGKDIVVAHEPDHLTQKFQNPDLRQAIAESFNLAERQLVDFKEKQQGRTKTHAGGTASQMTGQVAEMNPDQDHGFLMTAAGGLLYFHRNSLLSGDFDALKRGDRVHYVEDAGDTGPTASKVRAA